MEIALFGKKKPPLVGIDISSTSVKLLELSRDLHGYRVESYAMEDIPSEAIHENEIKNIEAVGLAVERALKRSRTRTKYGAIAVAGSSVITKTIQMNAHLNENEMAAQIQLEAERYIPFPLAEVNLDFQILGRSQKNPEMVDVLLAASRSEVVETLVEALNIGGLTAKVVDIEAYAIERAFNLISDQLPHSKDQLTVAIADIGANMTNVSVLYGRTTVYTREQMFGGRQLTEEIQRRYGLSAEEAKLAKIQGGLPEDYQVEVLEPFREAVVQQVSRSLQFFFSSSDFSHVDHIVLAGGTAALPGLAQKVREKLGIPTIVANPFQNMSIAPRVSVPAINADAPALMICCGLALRSFSDDNHY